MKKPVSVCLLLLLMACLLPAQDQLALDEITRYFPEGQYSYISHFDLEMARKSGFWDDYLFFSAKSESEAIHLNSLPDSLAEKWISTSSAIQDNVRIVASEEETPKGDDYYDTIEANGRKYLAYNDSPTMRVVRFPADINLLEQIKNAQPQAHLKLKIGDNKYSIFKFVNKQKRQINRYLYLSANNEILICTDLSALKKMIATDLGLMTNVDLDASFPELHSLFPDLGFRWNFEGYANYLKILSDSTESVEDYEAVDKEILRNRRVKIRGYDYFPGEHLQYREYLIYGSKSDAQEYLARIQKNRRESLGEALVAPGIKHSHHESRGRWVLDILTISPQYKADRNRISEQYWKEKAQIDKKTKGRQKK